MGKILSIDYGRKRIGLAISDEDGIFAFTAGQLTAETYDKLFHLLVREIQELDPELIVVGIPLGIDLKPTQMSLEVEAFIVELDKNLNIKVVKWNEVGTSKIAMENLKISKKKGIDSESARIILQEYLDFNRNK